MKRLAFLPALALLAWSGSALADKVAVLPFLGPPGASQQQIDEVRIATKNAVTVRTHTLASDAELTSAQMAVADGVADTSAEYRAAGRAATSQWTVVGHLLPRDGYWHLELEACQVETGRVESLMRNVDPRVGTAQIAEMLALLIRPEGLGTAEIPWANEPPPVIKPPPPPPPPPPPQPPPPPPAIKHAYAENFPIAVGLGFGLNGAFSRPAGAVGSSFSFDGLVSGEYAFAAVPGLALRGNFGAELYGHGAIFVDAGARYAIPLVPSMRLFFGPEITLGAFFLPSSGDKEPRFLLRTDVFAAMGLGERVQIEVAFDVSSAFGGSGAIILGGGIARGMIRF